ncbi:Zinc finger, RING/FYVE/PHD-type [Artemisia annua]|uniref:Zinc finger, RING/FYVE/PHD-type n=1 Tax=Artemisia annua TaxID=35608 RepID=A0A2U1KZ57_ARTAN|nr:Zinc finger, RING/FYVE/PHD-type [Artemisia annua]
MAEGGRDGGRDGSCRGGGFVRELQASGEGGGGKGEVDQGFNRGCEIIMNKCLASINLRTYSSSYLKNNGYFDKMRELCTSILSQLFIEALLMIFIFHFGVVGGTIGAVGGALIGFKNKMNFLQDVIEGAISGAILSHKITRLTFDQFLQCDHVDEHDYFLHLISIVAGDLEPKLLRDQDHVFLITKVASCEKLIKLPKIEISDHDLYDASGNATCCSICLQVREVAR